MSTEAKPGRYYASQNVPSRRKVKRRQSPAKQRLRDAEHFSVALAALKEWNSEDARQSCRIAFEKIKPFLRCFWASNTVELAFYEAIEPNASHSEPYFVEDCMELLAPGLKQYFRHLEGLSSS